MKKNLSLPVFKSIPSYNRNEGSSSTMHFKENPYGSLKRLE